MSTVAETNVSKPGRLKWIIVACLVVVGAVCAGLYFKEDAGAKAHMELIAKTRPKLLKYIEKHPFPSPPSDDHLPVPSTLPEVLKEPMKRSLKWLFANPVPMDRTEGILELSEEVLMTYQLYLKSEGEAREFMKSYVTASIAILLKNYDLMGGNSRAINDPFTHSNMLYIMKDIGYNKKETHDWKLLANKDMLNNPDTYTGQHKVPTMCALYDMGLLRKGNLKQNWRQSVVHYELESRWLTDMLMKGDNINTHAVIDALYTLTHEIIPMTNAGAHPMPFADDDEVEFIRDLMSASMEWLFTMKDRQVTDILSEIVVCANALGASSVPKHKEVMDRAYSYLMQRCDDEGTFGEDDRMRDLGRMSSLTRHGVYTGLWAMSSSV